METLQTLHSQLVAKGYEVVNHASLPIRLYFHPLVNKPVLLVGNLTDSALPYQQSDVSAAIKKR